MSKEALTKVVQRSISDAAFRRQLATEPSVLRGYDLTADEIGAVRSRDVAKLTAFGIDQRMSKMFFDPGMGGSSTTLTGGEEPRDVGPVWIGDGSTSREGALASGNEPRNTEPTWIGEYTGASSDGVATDEGQLTNDVQGDHNQISTGDGDRSE